jgi:arylsulfatase A-like enzyme
MPGSVPANRVDETSVLAGVDWLPTLCKVAGVALPEGHDLDGEAQDDVLFGESRPRTTPLFWEWRFRIAGEPFHHSPELAVRDGDWKLYRNPDGSRTELYDLRSDLTQLNNVAEKHPDVVNRLSEKLLAWAKDLPEGPRDPGAGKVNTPLPPTLRNGQRAKR